MHIGRGVVLRAGVAAALLTVTGAGAAAITDDGRVAGWSRDGTGQVVGTVWTCR